MARKVFYSFHYLPDCWRAAQVRNMGIVEGNTPCSDNDWETIAGGGDSSIKKWIAQQMGGRTCAVVLIGSDTANRKWINYEISEAWKLGKGVVGVYIHKLHNQQNKASPQGANPFDYLTLGTKRLSAVVKAYNPSQTSSTEVHAHIKANLASWIEEAIMIRANS